MQVRQGQDYRVQQASYKQIVDRPIEPIKTREKKTNSVVKDEKQHLKSN